MSKWFLPNKLTLKFDKTNFVTIITNKEPKTTMYGLDEQYI